MRQNRPMDLNSAELSNDAFEAVRPATRQPAESWWGREFHMTPGDLHVKHFAEPNDRDYES
jgi:hypothetical protein